MFWNRAWSAAVITGSTGLVGLRGAVEAAFVAGFDLLVAAFGVAGAGVWATLGLERGRTVPREAVVVSDAFGEALGFLMATGFGNGATSIFAAGVSATGVDTAAGVVDRVVVGAVGTEAGIGLALGIGG